MTGSWGDGHGLADDIPVLPVVLCALGFPCGGTPKSGPEQVRYRCGPGLMLSHQELPDLSRPRGGSDLMDDVTPTSLYRYFDSRGVLLYVGITSRGAARNVEHNQSQPWWNYVANQEVQHFDTRPEALKAEKQLIRRNRPPFNKQHNPDHGVLAAAYIRLQTIDPPGRGPGAIMHRNKGRLRMDILSNDGEFLHCRAIEADLPLSVPVNLSLSQWNTFVLPGMGLRGHVTNWGRDGYLVEMTLKAPWLDKVEAVRTLVDKKKRGYFIRTVELRLGVEWVSAKPQRFSDPYVDSIGRL